MGTELVLCTSTTSVSIVTIGKTVVKCGESGEDLEWALGGEEVMPKSSRIIHNLASDEDFIRAVKFMQSTC
jgi:hypothetical protein